jgi:hypothetical protein
MSVGDNTKIARSPLLPIRHQPDFFVCDIVDAAFKGDQTSMEHPVFSLSKKPDMKTRRYENGDKWMEIVPSGKGSPRIVTPAAGAIRPLQTPCRVFAARKSSPISQWGPRSI